MESSIEGFSIEGFHAVDADEEQVGCEEVTGSREAE